jgi:hypothetical protein
VLAQKVSDSSRGQRNADDNDHGNHAYLPPIVFEFVDLLPSISSQKDSG